MLIEVGKLLPKEKLNLSLIKNKQPSIYERILLETVNNENLKFFKKLCLFEVPSTDPTGIDECLLLLNSYPFVKKQFCFNLRDSLEDNKFSDIEKEIWNSITNYLRLMNEYQNKYIEYYFIVK